jgi:hypothetical protein
MTLTDAFHEYTNAAPTATMKRRNGRIVGAFYIPPAASADDLTSTSCGFIV